MAQAGYLTLSKIAVLCCWIRHPTTPMRIFRSSSQDVFEGQNYTTFSHLSLFGTTLSAHSKTP